MTFCIYCREEKTEQSFSLEHVIPKFLGGSFAPDLFKTRNVCTRCNNNLGLFVDASFAKDWFVSQRLHACAAAFFDPRSDVGLPLICLGETGLKPPGMTNDCVCEVWLGPFGEQVHWIRPRDERLYWYVGGNPITTSKADSRAYYSLSEKSHRDPRAAWLSFRDSFEDRKVRKIMCTTIVGADPSDIGFAHPDDLDRERIGYFLSSSTGRQTHDNCLAINLNSGYRFVAKLAIGLAFNLFGRKATETGYADELHKALWYRIGESRPDMLGSHHFLTTMDERLKNLLGQPNAVSLTIAPLSEGVAASLNIGTDMAWTMLLAPWDTLSQADRELVKDGIALILFQHLQKSILMPLSHLIAHRIGAFPHEELAAIERITKERKEYFAS